jgi:hypothetical protein
VLVRASDCAHAWLCGTDLETLMGTYNGINEAGPAPAGPPPSPQS